MDTKLDFSTGPTSVSAPSLGTLPAASRGSRHAAGGRKRRHNALYLLFVRSPFMDPFRHLLRPLLRWAWKQRLAIPGTTERANLKPPSTLVVALSILLGPLVFVMLLPLILILIPVMMFVGVLGVLATCLQFQGDESTLEPAVAK